MSEPNDSTNTFPEGLNIAEPATLMDLFRAGGDLSTEDLQSLRDALDDDTVAAALGATGEEVRRIDETIASAGQAES